MPKRLRGESVKVSPGRKRGVFNVSPFTNPSGETAYRVSGTKLDGTRVRENLATDIEARARVAQLEIEARNDETEETYRRTWLSVDQIQDAESAFKRIGDVNTLQKVVDHYLETYRAPVSNVSLTDALAKFLKGKEDSNARPLTVRNLKVRVTGLINSLNEGTSVSSVRTEDISSRIHRDGLAPSTRDNERRALRAFFRWAKRQGIIADDPTEAIDPIRKDQAEPEFMSLEEVRNILSAAQRHKEGIILPYTAVCLFAALRPTEAQRLRWSDVNFDDRVITIKGAHAKLRKRRRVAMSDNLVAWLKTCPSKKGSLTPAKNFRRDFDAVKKAAGWRGDRQNRAEGGRRWVPDIMRHTAKHMSGCKLQFRLIELLVIGTEMIRAITEQDVRKDFFDLMAEVEAGGWFDMNCSEHVQWLERKISRRVGCGGQFYATYLPDGQPLGIFCLVIDDHPTVAGHSEVLDLGVVKSHRRMGHGTRLLRDAESRSIAAGVYCLYLETYAGDPIAIAVYEKAGFVRLTEKPSANGPNYRGQILFWKELD